MRPAAEAEVYRARVIPHCDATSTQYTPTVLRMLAMTYDPLYLRSRKQLRVECAGRALRGVAQPKLIRKKKGKKKQQCIFFFLVYAE